MRVSIIIPTYNRARLVCHAIDSILAQDYKDYEIIVVDDGSTDSTPQVLRKYSGAIKYLRQENRGFGAARNRGLDEAKGEYLAFLDSDDLWTAEKLSIQVEIMDRLSEAAFVFSDFLILKPSGDLINEGLRTWHKRRTPWEEIYSGKAHSSALLQRARNGFDIYTGNIYRELLQEPYVLPSSAMVRRSMLKPGIIFTVGDPLYADWDFFARLARDHSACFLDTATAINRSHDDPVRLTTNCGTLRTAECRLSLIERVWEQDAEFMVRNRELVEKIEAQQLSIVATQLLFEKKAPEARAALKRISAMGKGSGATRLLELFAYSPGGPAALTAARGLRRRIRGKSDCRARTDSDSFKTEVITGPEGLRALSEEWDTLAARYKSPLASHDWALSCAEAFHDVMPTRVLLVRNGGKAAAIAPLGLTGRGSKRLELLGSPFLSEPGAILLDENEGSRPALFKALSETGYPALLRRLPASEAPGQLKEKFSAACFCIYSPAPPAPYACIGKSLDQLRALSPRRRYDIRRARKRAEAHGPVSVQISCPEPSGLERALDKVFRTEAAGWKGRNGSSMLHNQMLGRFFRAYSRRACRSGILRVCTLDIGGQTAAAQLAVESDGSFWVLKIGYDEKWGRCSPGIQLTFECMKYASMRNLSAYEFLGTVEPWLMPFESGRREHINLSVYPLSLPGMLALGKDAPRHVAKRLRGRLRLQGEALS
ncbi:MAG: GNAT family N-acetyltransferase [Candidatus Methylomirabilis sp.]|nr:GNAT family N-acetyltransferase [Deltaproteobacteria bacterium]